MLGAGVKVCYTRTSSAVSATAAILLTGRPFRQPGNVYVCFVLAHDRNIVCLADSDVFIMSAYARL